MKYKQVKCIKEAPGVTVGETYFGIVNQKGFIKIFNNDKVLQIYFEHLFKVEDKQQ